MDLFDTILAMAYMCLFFIVSVMVMTGMWLQQVPKLVRTLIWVGGVSISLISMYFGAMEIKTSYNDYLESSECVSKLIATGVERRDITVSNATCSRR